jgi:hypothetical protein
MTTDTQALVAACHLLLDSLPRHATHRNKAEARAYKAIRELVRAPVTPLPTMVRPPLRARWLGDRLGWRLTNNVLENGHITPRVEQLRFVQRLNELNPH